MKQKTDKKNTKKTAFCLSDVRYKKKDKYINAAVF